MESQNAERHLKVAEHLEKAAACHKEAAKCCKEGQHEKASHCAQKAMGHLHHAREHLEEIAKSHAR